jgi:hypothetical protein
MIERASNDLIMQETGVKGINRWTDGSNRLAENLLSDFGWNMISEFGP